MSVAINSSGSLAQGFKRRTSDDENIDSKRSRRYSWYFTLEEETVQPSSEDEESTYTAQEYETEFARDTSDTSTHTWVSDSDFESRDLSLLQYQLSEMDDSASDSNHQYNSLSSSSEPENILAVEFLTFCESEGMADDSDVSKCSKDVETRVPAFKTCVQCKNPNNNSLYQYCRKCFQERKTYFPRPRRKPRSTSKSSKQSDITTTSTSTLNTVSPSNSQDLLTMDSGIGLSQSELESVKATSSEKQSHRSSGNEAYNNTLTSESPKTLVITSNDELTIFASGKSLMSSQTSNTSNVTVSSEFHGGSDIGSINTIASVTTNLIVNQETIDEIDSGVASKDEPSSSQDSASSVKHDDDEDDDDDDDDDEQNQKISFRSILKRLQKLEKEGSASSMLCIICFENKRDSVFNHSKTGHQCCCYKCAKKVCKSNHNRCPMCNRQVNYITKIFLD